MASSRDWFETVAEAQRRAKRRLPKGVYLALVAGAETGSTMDDNVAAFGELKFRPHVADLPAVRDLSTTVMGQQVSFPVLISPTGVQAVHPDGEVAVARAAVAADTIMSLSSFASKPVEEVGAVARSCCSKATGSAPATTSWPGPYGLAPPELRA